MAQKFGYKWVNPYRKNGVGWRKTEMGNCVFSEAQIKELCENTKDASYSTFYVLAQSEMKEHFGVERVYCASEVESAITSHNIEKYISIEKAIKYGIESLVLRQYLHGSHAKFNKSVQQAAIYLAVVEIHNLLKSGAIMQSSFDERGWRIYENNKDFMINYKPAFGAANEWKDKFN